MGHAGHAGFLTERPQVLSEFVGEIGGVINVGQMSGIRDFGAFGAVKSLGKCLGVRLRNDLVQFTS